MSIFAQSLPINYEIPIWGVIIVVAGAVAAFAALKMQLSAHEDLDTERFESINALLSEVREDIKTLLSRDHHSI